jgi:hypothetical protein
VQFSTAAADPQGESADRAAINAGNPCGRTNAKTLGESGDNLNLLVARKDIHGANP